MSVQLLARFPFLPWQTEENLHGLNFLPSSRHILCTTTSNSSIFPFGFCYHLLHTTLTQFPFHHIQSRLVHLFGRVGRPQPAATLPLARASYLHDIPSYFNLRPRNSCAHFSVQVIRDTPCPNKATRRRVRESPQPP